MCSTAWTAAVVLKTESPMATEPPENLSISGERAGSTSTLRFREMVVKLVPQITHDSTGSGSQNNNQTC
jgi:hypothetical protein